MERNILSTARTILTTLALGELPGKFDPVDLRQVDPVTGKKAPAKFDPAMGMPIDPSTGAPFPIGTDNKPYDPISQKKMPGLFDPKTGRPINPTTGAAIPDKFNYKTGRPIDPLTGKPFPINEKGEPIDEAKNKKAAPCKFDPKTGVPTDKTFKPMNLNKPAKPEDLARRNPNETGNYHGRKFEPNVAPRLDNTKNNYKPRERKPSAEVAKPVEEEKKIGKLNPIKPGEGQTVPLNKTPKLTPVPNPKKVIDPTRLNYKPKDFVEEMTAIPQEESGRDMVLALADIWAKNPQAAEAFCNPETFSALNGLLEEARKTPDETARDELEDKIHCMVKNLINVLPEEAEKRAEILRPMELKNILPLISRKIDRIDETPENMKDDPVLRMKKIEDVEAALDVMEKVWTAAKDKGPFLEEDIPFKLLDKMDKLNCLGPEEAEKSGMAATMIADLAQAVNPMLNHPATGKYCQDLGALPILQNTLENLQDAKPLKPGQVQPKEVNINKPIKLSKKALDAALQSAVNAFKDLTGNKKVAGFIPLQPETPGNTFALLNEIAKANPDDPIVVSKASEAMANILKSHPVEDVKPIVPFLEKLHKDIMTIHSQFPTNPCTTDLLATVKGKIEDVKLDDAKKAATIKPDIKEEVVEKSVKIAPLKISGYVDYASMTVFKGLTPPEKKKLDNLMARKVLTPEEWKLCEDLNRKDGVSEENIPIVMKGKRKTTDPALTEEEKKKLEELMEKPRLTPEEWEECEQLHRKNEVPEKDLPIKMKGKKKTTDPLLEPEERKLLDELMAKPRVTPNEYKLLEDLHKKNGVPEEELPVVMKGKKKTTDPLLEPQELKRLDELDTKPDRLTPEEYKELEDLHKKNGVKEEDLPNKMKGKKKTTDPLLEPKELERLEELDNKPDRLTPNEYRELENLHKKNGVPEEDLPMKMKGKKKTTDPLLEPEEQAKLNDLENLQFLTPEQYNELLEFWRKQGLKDEDIELKAKNKRKTTDPKLTPEELQRLDDLDKKPDRLTPEEFKELEDLHKKNGVPEEELPIKMKGKKKTTDPLLEPIEMERLEELDKKPERLTPEEFKELENLHKKNGVPEEELPIKMKGKKKTTDPLLEPIEMQRLEELDSMPTRLTPEEFKELEDLHKKNGVPEEELPIKMKGKKKTTDPLLEPVELQRLEELESLPVLTPEQFTELEDLYKKNGVKDEDLPMKMKDKKKTTDPDRKPEEGDLGLTPKQKKRLDELDALPVLTPNQYTELEDLFRKDGVKDEDLPMKMKDKKKTTDPDRKPEEGDLGLTPKQKKRLDELDALPVLTPNQYTELEDLFRKDGVKDEDLPMKMKDKKKTTDPDRKPEEGDLGLTPKQKKRLDELDALPVLTPNQYTELEDLFRKDGVKDEDLPMKMKDKKKTTDPDRKPEEGDLGLTPKQKKRLDELDALPVLTPNQYTELEDLFRKDGVKDEDLPMKMKDKKKTTDPDRKPEEGDLGLTPKQKKRLDELDALPVLTPNQYTELEDLFRKDGVKDEDLPMKMKDKKKTTDPDRKPEEGDLGLTPKQKKRLDELDALPFLNPNEFKELEDLLRKDGVSEDELPLRMKGKRKTTQPVPEEQLKEMLDLENKPEIEPSEYEKIVEFWKQQGLKEEDIPLNIKNKRKVVAPPGEEIVPVEPAFVESTSDSAVFQKPIEKHQTEPIEITEDFTKVLKTFEKYQVDPLEISDERMVWLKTFERFAFEPAELESVHEYAVMNMPLEPCIIYHYEGNGTFETIMIYPVMKRIPPREVDCPIWDKTTWVKPKPLEKKAIVLDPVTPVPVPDKPKEPEFVPEKIPEAKLKPKPKEVNLAVRARPKKRAADSDDEKAPDESTPVAESPPKKKEGLTPEERERLDELLAKLLDGLKPEELDELKNLLKQDGMTEEEIALKLKPKAKPIVNDIAVAPPKAKPKEVNLNVKPKPRKRAADSDEEEPKEQDLGLNPKERKRLDELLDRPVLTPEQWDECVALLKKDGVLKRLPKMISL
jgi:hypothetical protein